MAPEVLFKQPTTRASDVYAWAVAVNEMATGVFPFADCTKDNPQCQTILNFGYGRRAALACAVSAALGPPPNTTNYQVVHSLAWLNLWGAAYRDHARPLQGVTSVRHACLPTSFAMVWPTRVLMSLPAFCRQELAAAVAAEGLRPILAPDTPAPLAALLEAAWQLAPGARPTAAHLEAELAALLARMDASPTPAADAVPASTVGPAPVLAAQNGDGAAHAPAEARDCGNGAAALAEDGPGAPSWGVAKWERGGSSAAGSFKPKALAGPAHKIFASWWE